MNPRERNLLILVGGLAALLVVGFGLRYVITKPLQQLDKQIDGLRAELTSIATERRNYFADEDRVKAFAQRTFSDDLNKASAKSGEILTRLILQSGLHEEDFTRLPAGPRKLRNAGEIGWNVQGDGPLMPVVNLLFLLQESPYLRRVDGVTISPAETAGKVRVKFRYLTLVLVPAPEVEWKEPMPKFTLDSPERRILDSIVARDILRPYIQRPPAPPVKVTPGEARRIVGGREAASGSGKLEDCLAVRVGWFSGSPRPRHRERAHPALSNR
jgi:hypothetical protein